MQPLSTIKLTDFYKAVKEINDDKVKEVLSQLGNCFNNDPIWLKDSNLEIDIEKFFGSSMFRLEGSQDQGWLDWKLFTLFALFTCK